MVFDPAQKAFIVDTRAGDEWSDNITFAPGTAFWVSVPTNAPNPAYTLVLSGQVPAGGTVTNVLAGGMHLLGNPYPPGPGTPRNPLVRPTQS